MEAREWQRLKTILDAAADLGPGERRSLLERECGDNHFLRNEAEALLAADREAAEFIEHPNLEFPRDILEDEELDSMVGRQFGAWRIVREIGRGGLGTVYLATRADDAFRKEVALKIVRRGLDTEDILRRFRHEREILAQLNHPNIARLLDAGTSDGGRPYFVMEFIPGEPITDYVRQRNLSVRERIDLFRKICAAVTYAHQNLVIHRDLKPSNILVDREGDPKLLDFGIAKLLSHDDDSLAATILEQRALTPDYASPEQIRGQVVTTSSDIYSLGVLLYELLTEARPFRRSEGKERGVEETGEPIRPSTVVGGDRSSKLAEQSRLLRGDLDNIALMALRSEPSRRYPSVAQFSDDLRRYLEGMPVLARKDTVRYRAGKFIQRNKLVVAAAVLLVLALVGGIIATGSQAQRAHRQQLKAEHRFNQVRSLANSILFELHDAIEPLPGSTKARELLVSRALTYLDSLAQETSDDRGLQRELALAYLKVGNVQGNPSNANLGDTSGALKSYAKALALAAPLSASATAADGLQFKRPLALVYEKTSNVEAVAGDLTEAVRHSQQSLGLFQDLAEENPDDVAAQRSFALSSICHGDVLGNPNFPNASQPKAAMSNYQIALALLQKLTSKVQDNSLPRWLGVVYERIGTMQGVLGNPEAARATFRQSLELRARLAAENPTNTDMLRDEAVAHANLGDALVSLQRFDEARQHHEQAFALRETLLARDAQNTQARGDMAVAHNDLAKSLDGLGRCREAAEHVQAALKILEDLQAADPANRSYAPEIAKNHEALQRFKDATK